MNRFQLAALLLAGVLGGTARAAAPPPQKILLWPAGAPGAMANGGDETVRITEQGEHIVSNVHAPSLTAYLPASNPSGAAVVVMPGGGHRELWTDHEGHAVARFLNAQGIAAFVLYYRLERAPNSTYKVEEHALADLRQAMRTVRAHAKEWSLDPRRIGTMGFSAGGQLALLGALRADTVDGLSSRPDFVALVYPGNGPEAKFDAQTPPMYLLAGSDDRPGVITMLTQTFAALREARVPAELHFYDGVPHGFGLRASNTGPVSHWPAQFVDWLRVRQIL
jgi:endo-1,4-beta-xylanase